MLLLALASRSWAAQPEDEEYAVYNAVIQKRYVRPAIKRVVISDQTEIYPHDRTELNAVKETDSIRKAFAAWSIGPDTVASYFARNKVPSRLRNRFALSVPTVLLSHRRQRGIQSGRYSGRDYWGAFYEQYPDSTGILAFSRVGFSSAMDQAFVYVGNACGSLCGVGEYYLLSKKNGHWKVEAVFLLWVS
jgi:hypothetical protein